MGLFSQKNDQLIVTQIADHQSDILAYLQTLLPSCYRSSVRDVQQRVNIVIWKKRSNFEPGTNFIAWAFSIARWEVKAFLKEKKKDSWLVVDEDLANQITEVMTEESVETPMHEMRTSLEQCIGKLKPKDQELITHRYYSEGTLAEYTSKDGRKETTLKVTLYRIRATLKRCIEANRAVKQMTRG